MYSIDLRRMILKLYERVRSLRMVAELVGVSRSSISRWRKCILQKHRTPRGALNDPILLAAAKLYVETHPFTTSHEIRSHFCATMNVRMSLELARLLRVRCGLTWKRARNYTTPATHETHRAAFVERRDRFVREGRRFVSVDETSFGRRGFYPVYGYSAKGTRLNVSRAPNPALSRSSVSAIVAVSPGLQTRFVTTTLTFNTKSFAAFLRSLRYRKNTVILLDNVSFHHSKLVREIAEGKGWELLFTPPYSPVFNPVEGVFSVAKRTFRRIRDPAAAILAVSAAAVKNFFHRSISATTQID